MCRPSSGHAMKRMPPQTWPNQELSESAQREAANESRFAADTSKRLAEFSTAQALERQLRQELRACDAELRCNEQEVGTCPRVHSQDQAPVVDLKADRSGRSFLCAPVLHLLALTICVRVSRYVRCRPGVPLLAQWLRAMGLSYAPNKVTILEPMWSGSESWHGPPPPLCQLHLISCCSQWDCRGP